MGSDALAHAGYVYCLVHPSWPGYVKIGKARNLSRRLSQYNTGDPLRRYEYAFTGWFPDCDIAERIAQRRLRGYAVPDGGEWFQISVDDAYALLNTMTREETVNCQKKTSCDGPHFSIASTASGGQST